MDTIQLTIETKDAQLRDILIAQLSEAGFDAFEEHEDVLMACLPAEHFDEAAAHAIISAHSLHYSIQTIPQQNWNAAWEASYEPVIIDSFCIVRAQFHPPAKGYEHEIIITPKMSFGTGHHATTRAMMSAMRELDFRGKEVLDFGAGTGILSILAAKLGAARVLAIDHEEWAAQNAEENVLLNKIAGITVKQGSLDQARGNSFDVILTNINRHILLHYMQELASLLTAGGSLLLSGILKDDEEIITAAAIKEALKPEKKYSSEGWLALLFCKAWAQRR